MITKDTIQQMNAEDAIQEARRLETENEERITRRDWFAGNALAGLASEKLPAESAARMAYEYADAMEQARTIFDW